MSDYTPKEGQFTLFSNEEGQKKNPKSPAWKGDGLLNGRAMEAAIWLRQGNRGEFMSMVVKEKQQHREPRKPIEPELPLPKVAEAVPGDEIEPLPF